MRTNNRAIILGLLASMPAWLGGDLSTWKLGVFALALAAYGFFYPPGFDLSRQLKWVAGLLVCWPLTGFLPRLISAEWHEQLTGLGVDIGWCWTPQPWVLLDSWLVVLIGGYWFLCLFGSKLDLHETHIVLRAFGVSIVGVALVALVSSLLHVNVPGWDPFYGIGPFPNRNQAGNLYALSGLMLLALASHESRNGRAPYVIWAGCSAILFLTTVVNGSRTGVMLFLTGVLLWAGFQLNHTKDKRKAVILISIAGLFLAAFLFIGGEALERLTATVSGIKAGEGALAGRWEIWQDSARLMSTAPLHGVGIGNYSELFALYREKLVAENRVIHPDSDYVWWMAEVGIIGLALIGWAVVLCLVPYFKGSRRTGRRLRSAAAIASLLFLVHALVDVSAHRIGTLLPALLWLRLSWPAFKVDDFQIPVVGKKAFIVVVAMFGIGLWFVIPKFTTAALPNTTYVEKVKADWQESFEKSSAEAMENMRSAESIAPLDWEVHYYLGLGALLHAQQPDQAWKHLTIARTLEPMLAELPYQEGRIWLRSDIARAWFVWREALKRRNLNRSGLLRDMLVEAKDIPELEETLLFLASRMPELKHFVLGQLTDNEFKRQRDAYLKEVDPEDLESRGIMQRVFSEWSRRDGEAAVAAYVRDHPEWMKTGWRHVVQEFRAKNQYRQAYQFMKQAFPKPAFPDISVTRETRKQHLGRIVRGSGDLVSVYSFLKYDGDQLSFEKGETAIQQVLQGPKLPHYMRYVIADYLAGHDKWKGAIGHMEHYGNSLEEF